MSHKEYKDRNSSKSVEEPMKKEESIVERRFEIDTKGFATQMSEMKLWRLIQEIISNSFDEKPVTVISCDISQDKKGRVVVDIVDNGNGFRDEKDIYTLFKDSYKRVNKNQRGRYNLGEKQFFARAISGWVKTGKTLIEFQEDTRRVSEITEIQGAQVHAVFENDEDESLGSVITSVEKVAVPESKKLKVNGTNIEQKTLIKTFTARLPTVIALGANQKLVKRVEDTKVFLYEKEEQDNPIIFELGCVVQEIEQDLRWHVDIQQKIPQTTDRNVVSDAYLQKLYAEITENTLDLIDKENCGANWINEALKRTEVETTKEIFVKRYGTDNVMIESSDSAENERAQMAGAYLIPQGTLDSEVVNHLKDQGTLTYASKEHSSSGWEHAVRVEPTEGMKFFAKVCKAVAKDVIKEDIDVDFVTTKETEEFADYSKEGDILSLRKPHSLVWNVRRCGGKRFFDKFSAFAVGTLCHEIAHDKWGQNEGYGHFSHEFLTEFGRTAGEVGLKGIQYWIDKVKSSN